MIWRENSRYKISRKGVKLDEYFVLDDDIFQMYDWWYDTFRYTQSKRGSKKVNWCTTGA